MHPGSRCHHHEWYNGAVYPRELSEESIPLSAGIGAVADVYDALTSRRPSKEAWSHDKAVAGTASRMNR